MRRPFIHALVELAVANPKIVLMTADLGYTVLEPFRDQFPDRFFNMGVAEQNMIGAAAGLAEAGWLPFVYSISTFLSMRGYEFIRNAVVAQQLPVRLIGSGAGFDYPHEGLTHYALEDVGILRLQPGLSVYVPADARQAKTILKATWNERGPVFYRLSKEEKNEIPGLPETFNRNQSVKIRAGSDLLILALGDMAAESLTLADQLAIHSIGCEVRVVSTISPAPNDDLESALRRFRAAVTLECHYATGGLGSIVAELIADRGLPCKLHRAGVKELWDSRCGNRSYMMDKNGLSVEKLTSACLQLIKNT